MFLKLPRSTQESSHYAEAAALGFFVKSPDGSPYVSKSGGGTGSLIDFTNPRARLWWQDQLRLAMQAGADGFEAVGAEPDFTGDATFSAMKFNDESDARMMRNRYAVLSDNAMQDVIGKDLKGNGTLLLGSATTGANGLGFLLEGGGSANFSPEDGLPAAIIAGLNAGLSGMPLWAAAMGGYQAGTAPDPQLFMRWT